MPTLVDTNVVVYAYDGSAGEKHTRALALLQGLSDAGELLLSAQVLNELCAVLIRARATPPLTVRQIADIVEEVAALGEVVPLTAEMTRAALGAVARHGMSFWDALVWAAAHAHGVQQVYTEDFQHGQEVQGVRFINPFVP